ncbi:MAG: A/G-specific adenine glycosylase [Flavobacteriales bacterium]
MREILSKNPKSEWINDRHRLLNWFETNQRSLPWRETPSSYTIWLCEIIMQQTRIDQGMEYWNRFVEQWPTVHDLANADENDVLKMWQGLGYYSRARNLHRGAKMISTEFNGEFPNNAKAWQKIPGVGPYTAAAISSICFGEATPAIDGNVYRVLSRYLDVVEPIDRPAGKKPIEDFSNEWIDRNQPGKHNESLMELGALICTPRNPKCLDCPLQEGCKNFQTTPGTTPMPPIKAGKTPVKPLHIAFHVVTDGERVWMRQRGNGSFWAQLWEFPSTESAQATDFPDFPFKPGKSSIVGIGKWNTPFQHILSHRRLTCEFWVWKTNAGFNPKEGLWLSWDEARALPIPQAIDRFWHEIENSHRQNERS